MNSSKSLLTAVFLLFVFALTNCTKDDQPLPVDFASVEMLEQQSLSIDPAQLQTIEIKTDEVMIRGERSVMFSNTFNLKYFPQIGFFIDLEKLDPAFTYSATVTPLIGSTTITTQGYQRSRSTPYRLIRSGLPSSSIHSAFATRQDLIAGEDRLYFTVSGARTTKFKIVIAKEIKEPVISDNLIPCTCPEEEDANLLICENFENYDFGNISKLSPHFITYKDVPHGGGTIEIEEDSTGLNTFMWMQELEDQLDYENRAKSYLNLDSRERGFYKLSFDLFIPEGGMAEFEAPSYGGHFTLRSDGSGHARLSDRTAFHYRHPGAEQWYTIELFYEPQIGLYRCMIDEELYTWRARSTTQVLDVFTFVSTSSGYRVDNICYLEYM